MIKPPKAILFDMDDTIVAWDMVSDKTWRSVCDRMAPETGKVSGDALYAAISHFRTWYLSNMDRHVFARLNLRVYRREIVTMAFSKLELESNCLVERIADTYGVERENACYLLPGVMDTLLYLKERGIRLALVTNGMSDGQQRKVDRFNFNSIFDVILIEGNFGTGKPESKVFEYVLNKLQVNPGDAWMVGDHLLFDIGGGQKAGLYSIWVDWERTGLAQPADIRPDRIITSISELIDLV